MRIGFIGAGKVGFSLGKHFVDNEVSVSGYYSYNSNSSKEAAIFTGTQYYEDLEQLVKASDTLFLTVPDGSIGEVYSEVIQYDIEGKCLVHCSGAMSSMIFQGISKMGARGCSVHPICAVSSKLTGYQELSKAYFTVEGENTKDLEKLIRSCGNPVELISSEQKVKYHAAAVFASNLAVSLYDIAAELLIECGLSAEFSGHALKSLFMGNAKNIVCKGTEGALTGPVERADISTIEKHLASLQGEQKEIYLLLSRHLVNVAGRKNPTRDYSKIDEFLENAE